MRLNSTEYRRWQQCQQEIEHLGRFDSQAESVAVQLLELIGRINSATYQIEDKGPLE